VVEPVPSLAPKAVADVAFDTEMRKQLIVLKDKSNLALGSRYVCEVSVIEPDDSVINADEAGDTGEKC
jgi:hypothetical protein